MRLSPNSATRATNDVVAELLRLAKGSPRESEIREWVQIWPVESDVLALIEEFKAEREARREERKRAVCRLPGAETQSLATVLKINSQTNQRALEAAEAALREAQQQRQRDEYVQRMRMVNEQAVELGYAQRQWEALAERRYDPMGLYGPANYRRLGEELCAMLPGRDPCLLPTPRRSYAGTSAQPLCLEWPFARNLSVERKRTFHIAP